MSGKKGEKEGTRTKKREEEEDKEEEGGKETSWPVSLNTQDSIGNAQV